MLGDFNFWYWTILIITNKLSPENKKILTVNLIHVFLILVKSKIKIIYGNFDRLPLAYFLWHYNCHKNKAEHEHPTATKSKNPFKVRNNTIASPTNIFSTKLMVPYTKPLLSIM